MTSPTVIPFGFCPKVRAMLSPNGAHDWYRKLEKMAVVYHRCVE
jgi:hypothetical protein